MPAATSAVIALIEKAPPAGVGGAQGMGNAKTVRDSILETLRADIFVRCITKSLRPGGLRDYRVTERQC